MSAPPQDNFTQRTTRRGFGLAGDAPLNTIREAAADAEVRGYHSFWLNQSGSSRGLVVLAEAGDATLHIDLGTGVIPLSAMSAEDIAYHLGDLHMPLRRLLLGIGSGAAAGGVERVRAGLQALREALSCRLFVAALGPRMCRLAGEAADGVLLNWLVPEYAGVSIAWVREGAEATGRSMPLLYAYVRLALGDASIARLEREAARYTAIPHYRAHLERQGVSAVETAVRGRTPQEIQEGLARWDGLVDEVVVRALPAEDAVGETLRIVEAAAPPLSL